MVKKNVELFLIKVSVAEGLLYFYNSIHEKFYTIKCKSLLHDEFIEQNPQQKPNIPLILHDMECRLLEQVSIENVIKNLNFSSIEDLLWHILNNKLPD